ncbi:MAG: HupE/UreJ family protein [Deltaproteobacteria bacterium]|nr:HupE/UreJ family protein [Deltaproteobacteria bacterium]
MALIVLAAGCVLALVPRPARAHPLEPSLLDIREAAGGGAALRWKRPAGATVLPLTPYVDGCTWTGAPQRELSSAGTVYVWSAQCQGGLAGRRIGIDGLAQTRANALVRVVYIDGRVFEAAISASRPWVEAPREFTRVDVAHQYVTLGVEHILSGLDHLMFVFGLLLLVRFVTRPLLATVTAFTVGHSITLSAAMLGFVHVPTRPLELAIALSVFVLAAELTRGTSGRPTLIQRMPWLMSGVFGLLHGFGFAGALAEVGLPDGEIPFALLSFNIGIECGQLVFVAAVLAVWTLLARRLSPPVMRLTAEYALGSLAAMWCFERGAALLG